MQKSIFTCKEYLEKSGFKKNDCLLIIGNKSCEFLAVLLSCLFLGIVYVPIETPMPEDRVQKIANEVHASGKFILGVGVEKFPYSDRTNCDDEDVLLFYTSGSTGCPKAVRIHAENILNLVQWAIKQFSINFSDRFCAFAPWNFDLSVIDIYAALLSGASIFPVPSMTKTFPQKMSEWLKKNKITIMYMVPTALRYLLKHSSWSKDNHNSIRCILFAGEVYGLDELKNLRNKFPRTLIANLYGPTETNVCSWCEIPEINGLNNWVDVPIGVPIPGFELYIDGNSNQGELICVGPFVSPGYLYDTNSSSFFSHFGSKAYRTGDLVKNTGQGFVFLGRKDRQTKLYGYRIDPCEIEAYLRSHPAVKNAAVSLMNNQLIAFISLLRKEPVETFVWYCAEHFQRHYCPSKYVYIDEIPLTISGKIDYKMLLTKENSNEIASYDA